MELDRSTGTPLCVQIAGVLAGEIASGTLPEGSKVSGERILSRRFGTSRGTVIEALNILEKKNLIKRIPAQGTFVQRTVDNTPRRILLPFPEKAISLESMHGNTENWQISREIQHGLMISAGEKNWDVAFRYVPDSGNLGIPEAEVANINAHGAVFIGWQLGGLSRQLSEAGVRCVRIGHNEPVPNSPETLLMVDFRSDVALMLSQTLTHGYRRILVLVENEPDSGTALHITHKLAALNCAIQLNPDAALLPPPEILRLDPPSDAALANVAAAVDKAGERCAIFCFYTAYLPPVHAMLLQHGKRFGHDVGLLGYATGVTFQSLVPPVTYIQNDHTRMGYEAGKIITDDSGTPQPALRLIPGTWIPGATI